MDEKSNKHEKATSHEDDEYSSADTDSEDESEQENRQSEDTDTKREQASFFKRLEKESDKKEEAEQEPNLSEEEVQEATLALVDTRTQEISEELEHANPDSPEEFEAVADAVFLESLQDLVTQEIEVTPELLDEAFKEAIEDLELTAETDHPETDAIEQEVDDSTNDASTRELLEESEVDDGDSSTTPTVPVPPIPPTPPTPPVGPPSTPFTPSPGGPLGQNYYTQPMQQNMLHNSPNSQPVIVQEIHNHHSDLLLGVIVGYIIGRRGGRKRTEKKLQPKIDNLEEQVKVLHDAILEKEILIRKIARKNMESTKPTSATAMLVERRRARKDVKETLRRRKELAMMPGVEKIGRFSLPALKVFHERRLPDGTENSPKRVQVEVMTTEQLLEKVEGLTIHGLRVTEMFHRSRLSVDALRQITKEYLRSGPYEKTFFHELQPDPQHIETLTKQVIEKNKAHAVDETLKSQFAENPARNKDTTFIDSQKKKADAVKALKKQRQFVVSGVLAGIVLAAIMVAFLLAR